MSEIKSLTQKQLMEEKMNIVRSDYKKGLISFPDLQNSYFEIFVKPTIKSL